MKTVTLKNKNGIEVDLLSVGASIKAIKLPNEKGELENIVLTHQDDETYRTNPGYFGCTVGRTAGRIKDSKFEINGVSYTIDSSHNGLHGGRDGLSFRDFEVSESSSSKVIFTYFSKDLESGYPGNLDVKVTYTLNDNNQLTVDYYGLSDQDTILNLTNHSYFNLSGNKKEKILDHYLTIESDYILEANNMVPTGKLIDVENSLYDFRKARTIGSIYEYRDYSEEFRGLDDTWILEGDIVYYDPNSNRKMTIQTNYPAVVSYIFNYPEEQVLEDGSIAFMHQGIAFECQYEPNGVNTEQLSSSRLKAGEVYSKQIKYSFEMR